MKIYSYNGKGILTLREALHLAFLDLSETKIAAVVKMHASIHTDLDFYSWLETVYDNPIFF